MALNILDYIHQHADMIISINLPFNFYFLGDERVVARSL